MSKTILTNQFSSDLDKIIEGTPLDAIPMSSESYRENIDVANLFIEAFPKPSINQKEAIKSKVFERLGEDQSIWRRMNNEIHFSMMSMKKRTAVATAALVLCSFLLFTPTMTLAENTLNYFKEIIATYQLGNHTTVQQVTIDERAILSDFEIPQDLWMYTLRIGTFCGNSLPGESSELQIFKSIEEGRKASPFTIKIPTYMPKGSTLREMVLAPGNYIFLTYDSLDGEINIVQILYSAASSNYSSFNLTTDGETSATEFNGKDAVWLNDINAIIWNDDNLSFMVGGNISQDEVLKIANSLE